MARKVIIAVSIFTIFCLVITRPALPVWVGAGLMAYIMRCIEIDLSAKSARKRFAAFKRIVLIALLGIILIAAGACVPGAPWYQQINSASDARSVLPALLLYSVSILVAPALVLVHLLHRESVARLQKSLLGMRKKALPSYRFAGADI